MGDMRIHGAIVGHTNMDLDCFGSIAPDISLLEDGELVGIITRTDYLACRRAEKEKAAALTGSLL